MAVSHGSSPTSSVTSQVLSQALSILAKLDFWEQPKYPVGFQTHAFAYLTNNLYTPSPTHLPKSCICLKAKFAITFFVKYFLILLGKINGSLLYVHIQFCSNN